MKKISFILAIIMMFTMMAFIGCDNTSTTNKNINEQATFNTISGQEVVLYDYEDISDFQEINAQEGFGITSMNTEPQYVKSGKGSMHVRVDGYDEFYHFPEKLADKKQVIVMYPNWFFDGLSDFSDALAFQLDVYNVSDRDITISIKIQTAITTYVLGPEVAIRNKWCKLVFEVDFEKSIYLGLNSVKQISYVFENRIQGQTSAECYIDNFSYVKSQTKSKKLDYVPDMVGNVLCDFEDKYFSLAAIDGCPSYPKIAPYYMCKSSWNSDKRYVTSGNYSLKITRFPSIYNHSIHPEFSGVYVLSREYIEKINWDNYDISKTSIFIDVYNDYDDQIYIRLDVIDGRRQGFANRQTIDPNKWTTLEFPMYDEYMDWTDLQIFSLTFYDFYGVENSIVYIDNIRFGNTTV